MTADRDQLVDRLFERALYLDDPAERAAFLDEACRGQPTVRSAVESLLAHNERAEAQGFLPARSLAPADDAAPPPAIPGYEILGELGRGGMGVVYRARHLALGRLVALKVIGAGRLAGPDERARFRGEAEAAARLRHPHIVAVHDVGEHDGCPYLALEYVEGGSLAERLRGATLPPREAAALAEVLARAVQHAHEAKVVHRDLKPANVLLTFSRDPQGSAAAALPCGSRLNDGAPKVTDFGLARRLDGPGLTGTGAILGTPSYMAPEQAEGKKDVGPPADVYALGAILYECLTGRPPFKAATTYETLLQVVGEEPVPPRQLNRAVPRDLETVCLKCLHKEPAKRYARAQALGDDLRRFLDGRPVLARPVGAAGRLWRWCRREPRLAASLGLAAALLLAVAATATTAAVRVAAARDGELDERLRAEKAGRAERRARELAERHFRDHLRSVQGVYRVIGGQHFYGDPAAQPLNAEVLRVLLTSYDDFLRQQGDDPTLRAEVANVHFHAAQVADWLGQKPDALARYETARGLFARLVAEADDRDTRLMLARTDHHQGILRAERGDWPGALAAHDRARQGFAAFAADRAFRHGLASTLQTRASLLRLSGQPRQAARDYEQARQLLDGLPDEAARVDLAWALVASGTLYLEDLGRPADAQRCCEEGRDRFRRLAAAVAEPARSSCRYGLALSLRGLGDAHARAGRRHDARTAYDEALAVQQELVRGSPHAPRYREGLALIRLSLAELHWQARADEDAVSCYRAAQAALREPGVGRSPYFRVIAARVEIRMAVALRDKEPAAAVAAAATAVQALDGLLSAASAVLPAGAIDEARCDLATALYVLGLLRRREGKGKEADTAFARAETALRGLPAGFVGYGRTRADLGVVYSGLGHERAAARRPAEALAHFRRAHDVLTGLLIDLPDNLGVVADLARASFSLGVALEKAGRRNEALAAFRDAASRQAVVVRRGGERHADLEGLTACYVRIGQLQRGLGRQDEAVAIIRQWRELRPENGRGLYKAGCELALCAAAVSGARANPTAEEFERWRLYTQEAAETLDRAVRAGNSDAILLRDKLREGLKRVAPPRPAPTGACLSTPPDRGRDIP